MDDLFVYDKKTHERLHRRLHRQAQNLSKCTDHYQIKHRATCTLIVTDSHTQNLSVVPIIQTGRSEFVNPFPSMSNLLLIFKNVLFQDIANQ